MLVTRTSPVSGEINQREINITEEQLIAYQNGELGHIQRAFPRLSADDREFILTGTTPEEWNAMFPDEDDLDNDSDWEEGYNDYADVDDE